MMLFAEEQALLDSLYPLKVGSEVARVKLILARIASNSPYLAKCITTRHKVVSCTESDSGRVYTMSDKESILESELLKPTSARVAYIPRTFTIIDTKLLYEVKYGLLYRYKEDLANQTKALLDYMGDISRASYKWGKHNSYVLREFRIKNFVNK